MEYSELKKIRDAVTEELKQEIAPAPFTLAHVQIVEARVQSILMMRRLSRPQLLEDKKKEDTEMRGLVSSIKESAEDVLNKKKRP